MWPALIRKRADGDIFQAMAARANLGEHLQTALQLQLIIGAEGAFKAKVDILGIGRPTRGHGRSRGQDQCRDGADCDFAKHLGQFLSVTHSAAPG